MSLTNGSAHALPSETAAGAQNNRDAPQRFLIWVVKKKQQKKKRGNSLSVGFLLLVCIVKAKSAKR